MKKYKKLNIKVIQDGGILVNGGFIIEKSKTIAAVSIDLKTKRGDIAGWGYDEINGKRIPNIHLDPKGAIHIPKNKEKEWTGISFPDFKGWDILCSELSRYTLSICFVKWPWRKD